MEVGGQRHAPAGLPPGKTRYPLYRRLGGPQCRSERVRKISPPTGFDPRTVHPVANRYTDCAVPAHFRGSYRSHIVEVNLKKATLQLGLRYPGMWFILVSELVTNVSEKPAAFVFAFRPRRQRQQVFPKCG